MVAGLMAMAPIAASGQSGVVDNVKATLVARGVDLSGPCGALQITKRVAWMLRGQGAGLLEKATGNQCENRAVDIIVFNDGHGFDILTDSGGANGPSWADVPIADGAARWRPVVADPDAGVIIQPPPPPPVPPSTVDLSAVLSKLAEIRDTQERIYADETNQRKDQTTAIVSVVNSPGWVAKLFENRYVQLALAGFGTYFMTHQVMKP
jgi:hypothetical protein